MSAKRTAARLPCSFLSALAQGDLQRLDVRTGVLQSQLHQAELRRGRTHGLSV